MNPSHLVLKIDNGSWLECCNSKQNDPRKMSFEPANTSAGIGGSKNKDLPRKCARKIVMRNGQWIFLDPIQQREIPLNPIFESGRWHLERIGQTLGISRRTLARIVENSLGVAGKTWLRDIRIVRARHLIREGGKIGHVARSLGYRHSQDFTRVFRSQMGLSPTEFLESEQQRMFRPEKNT
jgi:AraC-like DNA-binding protein